MNQVFVVQLDAAQAFVLADALRKAGGFDAEGTIPPTSE
jgi:hypothetical protein